MAEMKQKRSVNREELAKLGFSRADIDTATNMEKRGYAQEPSPDLVERTIQSCIPLLRGSEAPVEEPSPLLDPVTVARGYFAAARALSPGLQASAEWKEFSRLQGFQQVCLTTVDFARAKRERPFMMIDNHNVVEPVWWERDSGFRAFWNACQLVNRIAAESGVPRPACLVVLRPRVHDYSQDDLAAIGEMLRRGTSDVWWIPYERAGGYRDLNLLVLGEERVLVLGQRRVSPAEAFESFQETTDEELARRKRRELHDLIQSVGTQIRFDGQLTQAAAANVGSDTGVQNLMRHVIAGEVVTAR